MHAINFNLLILIFQLVDDVKARLPSSIPTNWLREKYLVRCLERSNGGLQKGEVASYRTEWGRIGTQEVFGSNSNQYW